MGAILQRRGEYDSALVLLNKSIDIFNRTLPKANPFIALTYSTIGNVYLIKRDTSTACSFYERALDIFKQVYGEGNPEVTMCYNNLGLVYEREKMFDLALKY